MGKHAEAEHRGSPAAVDRVRLRPLTDQVLPPRGGRTPEGLFRGRAALCREDVGVLGVCAEAGAKKRMRVHSRAVHAHTERGHEITGSRPGDAAYPKTQTRTPKRSCPV